MHVVIVKASVSVKARTVIENRTAPGYLENVKLIGTGPDDTVANSAVSRK